MTAPAFAGQRILVTGAAGFIGMHVAKALLDAGAQVTGVDNFDPYYDVRLKEARLGTLSGKMDFAFTRLDLADGSATARLFGDGNFDSIVHLAAQPGVRYSLINPAAYVRNNVVAFGHILEGCRHAHVSHLVYASSSSVYGANQTLPFSEDQPIDHPVSLYAATKKANELMAYTYSHLYRLPATGLRFFTGYGPWGRPDQAPMLFAKAILAGEPIAVFNHGDMRRDFTYIDDVVEAVIKIIDRPPQGAPDQSGTDPGSSRAPWKIYNIGNNKPEELMHVVALLERGLGVTAEKVLLPMQAGDVPETFADVDELVRDVGFKPKTKIEDGIEKFVAWFREYHRA